MCVCVCVYVCVCFLVLSLMQIFNAPKYHPQSKPFFDHVITFSVVENCVWFRHFQILETPSADGTDQLDKHMVEIGPRFVLHLIRIFDSGFGGATLYENPTYIAPNTVRAYKKRQMQSKYDTRKMSQAESHERALVCRKGEPCGLLLA
jgi:ribosome biogenesis protein BRX1